VTVCWGEGERIDVVHTSWETSASIRRIITLATLAPLIILQ
jgi:hypothetical protein